MNFFNSHFCIVAEKPFFSDILVPFNLNIFLFQINIYYKYYYFILYLLHFL